MRTNLMLSSRVKEDAMQRAVELFGGNLSAYISYLVIKDNETSSIEDLPQAFTKAMKRINNTADEKEGRVKKEKAKTAK